MMRCGAVCLVVLTAVVSPPRLRGQGEASKVDTYVAEQMKKHSIPGLSLIVAREGRVLKSSAYGLANVELHVPATTDTVYQIASATKSFTATAVFQLIDDGKLKLTDTVGQLLPGLPSAWGGVTVHQLLTHTSGLPDVLVKSGRGPVIAETGEEALKKLAALPLLAGPGEKWAYNQTNYYLLLRIVEKLSGTALEEYFRQHFFEPLDMKSTRFGDSRDVVPARATSYERGPGGLRTRWVTFPAFLHSAAGVNTSAPDFHRWVEALALGKLVKPASLEMMWETVKLRDGTTFHHGKSSRGYACGFATDDRPGHRSVGHSGGGTAAFRYFRDDRLVVVVLLNGNTDPDEILEGIAAAYVPALAKVR